MPDLKDDIEKYLKGQLSPAERHALEKKALSDPFLADALEGADSVAADDFLQDVADLDRRIGEKQKGKRPWVVWRIAASIVLLVGASYLIYTLLQSQEPETLAQKTTKEEPVPPANPLPVEADKDSAKAKPEGDLLSLNPKKTIQPKREERTDAKPVVEPSKPLTLSTEPVESPSASGAVAELADDSEKSKLDEIKAPESEEKLAPAEQGPSDLKRKDKEAAGRQATTRAKVVASDIAIERQVINGKITDVDDGSPIPGATIVVKGTQEEAVSDVNGNYQLVTHAPGDHLVVSFIGYQTQEVKVPADLAPVNVQMPADISSLSEVIVIGEGSGEPKPEEPVELAAPVDGRKSYNKYLEKNLRYPSLAREKKIEGKVTVEFTVLPSGTLNGFTIVQGLEGGCNEEVIRLVKEGPRWRASTRGGTSLTSTVRVRVRFKLPK